jgi:pilus assembly protein CpaE
MAIYILRSDLSVAKCASITQELRTAFPEMIEISRIEDALQDAPAPPTSHRDDNQHCLVLLAPTYDKAQLEVLTDIAARYRDRLFFVLVGDEISASEYKALVQTGGADWVSIAAGTQELLDIISGARARRRTQPKTKDGNKPVVLSLVPSAGGVGNSTLGIEIGLHLKAGKRAKGLAACIVDLDFQSSHVCDYLDIEPRLKIHEISSEPGRLDGQLFDMYINRHSSGLHVFAAPRSKADPCVLNVEALDLLLDMISARYQVILIDLPVTWFVWTQQVIAASDGVIVTGINTIPGLRQAAETAAAARDIMRPSSQMAIAINRCQRRLGRVARRHHIESVLGREHVFLIAEDSMVLESVNSGRPIGPGRFSRGIGKDAVPLAEFCERIIALRVASR